MKACTKCGETKELSEFHKNKHRKDGLQFHCKLCINEYMRKYDRERRKDPKYRDRMKNNPKYRERKREYDRMLRKDLEYRERKRVYMREYHRDRVDDPEYLAYRRSIQSKRRVLKRGTLTEWDLKQSAAWRKVISKMPCYYCGTTDAESYHVDHRIPVSKGGDDSWINLVRACEPCNLSKSAKTDAEFFGWEETNA